MQTPRGIGIRPGGHGCVVRDTGETITRMAYAIWVNIHTADRAKPGYRMYGTTSSAGFTDRRLGSPCDPTGDSGRTAAFIKRPQADAQIGANRVLRIYPAEAEYAMPRICGALVAEQVRDRTMNPIYEFSLSTKA
jgi:hypothetical protein